eukprot:maker-scaffold271_size230452-snap-gene-0.10 protein:Tk11455 transcript:maker-scaffold271_size230452-snap-gene-0.10-mRNA-1 annotation:"ribosome biogenesis gtp-binding protein"
MTRINNIHIHTSQFSIMKAIHVSVLVFGWLISLTLADVDLNGLWLEDSGKRASLNDFLSASGVNFFTRTAISLVSFKNEQRIGQDRIRFTIEGKKGPRSDPYFYTLVADGETNTVVDMGVLGGPMDTISFLRGDTLETRVTKNGELMFISSRTRTGPKSMVHAVEHVASRKKTSSFYDKKGHKDQPLKAFLSGMLVLDRVIHDSVAIGKILSWNVQHGPVLPFRLQRLLATGNIWVQQKKRMKRPLGRGIPVHFERQFDVGLLYNRT